MFRKFIAAFVTILFAATIHTTAFAADESENISVTGYGNAPSNWDQRDSFAKTFARQAARIDALRQLAEGLDGVRVESNTEVDNDGNEKSNYIKTELTNADEIFKLLEKNARQVGEAKFSVDKDGRLNCEVTMELVIPADYWKN